MGGWVAGLFGNITNSAPNWVGLGLGLSLAILLLISIFFDDVEGVEVPQRSTATPDGGRG